MNWGMIFQVISSKYPEQELGHIHIQKIILHNIPYPKDIPDEAHFSELAMLTKPHEQ